MKEWPFTKSQRALRTKHGTPSEFAAACYAACPAFISMDEARRAIDKYNHEWEESGRPKKGTRKGRR